MVKKRKLFIAIAGNIVVGKTTLTQLLSRELGWHAYYERVVDNPYLVPFYADMKRWSFPLQIYFLSHRFKTQKEITQCPDSCIQDRSIYEDFEIFARTLYNQGFMSELDYQTYKFLFSTMVDYLRKPDLIVYLKAPVQRLIDRIQKRGRSYEQKIDRQYLRELNHAYDSWIGEAEQVKEFNIIRVDTRHSNFEKKKEDLAIIVQYIREMESQS